MRCTPSADVWTGASALLDVNWSDGANWSQGTPPTATSQAVFTTDPTVLAANGLAPNAVRNTNSNVDPSFSGSIAALTIDASWGGAVTVNHSLAVSGNLTLASGTLSTSAAVTVGGSASQWTGGGLTIGNGGFTNNGTFTIDTTNGALYISGGTFTNNGTIHEAGTNGIYLFHSTLNNTATGTFDFSSDGSINQYTSGTINNAGTITKSVGSGTSYLSTIFNNNGGTLDAESGILSIASGSGTVNGGVLKAGVGGDTTATIDLTNNYTVSYSGTFTGAGSGKVALQNGTLVVTSAGATFNLPGNLFQWTGGNIDVSSGGTLTNAVGAKFNINTTVNSVGLSGTGTFVNRGTLNLQGPDSNLLYLGLGVVLNNVAGGVFDIIGDTGLTQYSGGTLSNTGLLEKTSGTGNSRIASTFLNTGGAITVQTGTLTLAGGNGSFLNGGTFTVASGAMLDLTGNTTVSYQGTFTGFGTGSIVLTSGVIVVTSAGATFNMPGTLFQWTGGVINVNSGGTLTNAAGSVVNLDTTQYPMLRGKGSLVNRGVLNQAGINTLYVAYNATIVNTAGATIDYMGDGALSPYYGGTLTNAGTVEKTGGSGTAYIGTTFVNNGGTLDAESGTLSLSTSAGILNGGVLQAGVNGSTTAILDLTGNNPVTFAGTFTGAGSGTVSLSSGTLLVDSTGTTFNLPGHLFQWTGGNIDVTSGGTFTNAFGGIFNINTTVNNLGIDGAGSPANAGGFVNNGTINLSGGNRLYINNNSTLTNTSGAMFNIVDDSGVTENGIGTLINAGLLAKTGGNASTGINSSFLNNSGTLMVQSGSLVLNSQPGSRLTGGTFNVAQGATLDLTGGSTIAVAGTFNGSGAGTVALANGTLVVTSAGATFNLPGNLFQWNGGTIDVYSGGTLTNAPSGVVNVDVTNGVTLAGAGAILNQGLMNVAGTNYFTLAQGATLTNAAGATFNFTNDGNIGQNGIGTVNNAGTIKKTGGTQNSFIFTIFNNTGGSLVVQTGNLILAANNGLLNGGTFNVSAGATLDLTGNSNVLYSGAFNGSGAGTVSLNSGTIVVASAGVTFNLPGNLFHWTAGGIDVSSGGTFTNAAGATINIDTDNSNVGFIGSSLVNNFGTVKLNGPNSLYLSNGVVFNNALGATLEVTGDGGLNQSVAGTLNNAGLVEKTGGTGASYFGFTTFNNTGTLAVLSGSISLYATVSQVSGTTLTGGTWNISGGILNVYSASGITDNQAKVTVNGLNSSFSNFGALTSNEGTLSFLGSNSFTTSGDFTNNGTLVVGPASTVTVNGNFVQGAGGLLDVQLGGAPASSQFGQLSVNPANSATLGGTLKAELVNGYVPQTGDNFTVLNYSSKAGAFAHLTLPSTPALAYQAQVGGTNTILAAVGKPAISVTANSGAYTGSAFKATSVVTGAGAVVLARDGASPVNPATLTYTYYSGTTPLSGAPSGVGSYTVVAHYTSNNSSYASTDSAPTAFQVIGTSTTTTLNVSGNPLAFGQTATLTATVTGASGTPAGKVTFYLDPTPQSQGTLLGKGTLSGNTAVFSTATIPVGNHTVVAVYNVEDAGPFTLSSSAVAPLGILQAATSTTLSPSSSSPAGFGQPLSFTVTVTDTSPGSVGAVSGTVAFFLDRTATSPGTSLGNAAASGGIFTSSSLPAGVHTLTGIYNPGGTGNFQTSISAPISLTINAAATSTTLAPASTSPIIFGQAASFTATVANISGSSTVPTGTVYFYLDQSGGSSGVVAGSGSLVNGVATFTSSTLPVGSHTITATYNPANTGNFQLSSSAQVIQTVNQIATSTTLGAISPVQSVVGQLVTFTANVANTSPGSSLAPTGTVYFYLDQTATNPGIAYVSASLVNGQATASSSSFPAGNHTLTAVFNPTGAGNLQPSKSAPGSLSVSQLSTSTALTPPSPTPTHFGEAATFRVTVTNTTAGSTSVPAGAVYFYLDRGAGNPGNYLGGATLVNGVATFATATIPVGSHTVSAVFNPSGSGNFQPSSSSTSVTQNVTPDVTTTTLSQSTGPSAFGGAVSFTATVANNTSGSIASLSGPVSFYLDVSASSPGTYLGAVNLATNSTATLSTTNLPAGNHTVTAIYNAANTGSFAPSTSTAVAQLVNLASTNTTVSTTSSMPIPGGQSATFTATVANIAGTNVVPVGTVYFYRDSTPANPGVFLGSSGLINGVASVSTSAIPAGNHTVSAYFNAGGTGNFLASSGQLLVAITGTPSQSPTQAATQTTLTPASSAPLAFGQLATFTATVANSAGPTTPTGLVVFMLDQTPANRGILIYSGNLVNGQVTFSSTTLPAGNHTITAVYNLTGAGSFQTSTSAPVSRTITAAPTTTSLSPSSTSPISFGQSATFTATIANSSATGGTPTGTVYFYLDQTATVPGTLLTSSNLVNGTAGFSSSTLPAGSHTITAVFNPAGAGSFQVSSSAAVTQIVNVASTNVTVSPSNNTPFTYGQVATFTATVTNTTANSTGVPTGITTFYLDQTATNPGTFLGRATVVNGVATFASLVIPRSSHTVTAVFNPEMAGNFKTSTSAPVTQMVTPASTITALSPSSTSPMAFGQMVTFTATVTNNAAGSTGTPVGGVYFYLDQTAGKPGTLVGTGTLVNGVATFSSSTLTAGNHTLTAFFNPAAPGNFLGSSTAVAQTVVPASTSATLGSSSSSPTGYGQPVTFTASVTNTTPGTGGVPAGAVYFYLDRSAGSPGTLLGGASLANGAASFTSSTLPAGNHTVTAVFIAATPGNFATSVSNPVSQMVNPLTTSLVLMPLTNPLSIGQPITFTATVSDGLGASAPPTGTVYFYLDQTATSPGVYFGGGTVVNGVATFTISTLPAGKHLITAIYNVAGTGNFAMSNFASMFVTIG